jgi:hypothetical protein
VNDQGALERGLEEAFAKSWDRQAIAAWGQARGWRQVASEVVERLCAITGERRNRTAAGQD